ncbi:MAG: class I SAM-dependent methyltransferase [Candidatus Diapherotrites archaeon]|uniref:Class I SAM-dependent methyltransferase n=1 Tax=Candidatus Iainarchaeum sp. TaxID=3101447 RepID=A0A938YY38_9ARCH|nr:class I SAM-dependent methyltransferase [Candidatus Diapherotrites archaeon]
MSRKYLLRKVIGNRDFLDYDPKKFWTYAREDIQVDEGGSDAKLGNEGKRKALVSLIDKAGIKSAIEFGCGFGLNLKQVCEAYPNKKLELVGCDISRVQLEKAKTFMGEKNYKRAKLFEHDLANKMPYPDSSFDLVYSCGVLMHVLPKHIENVVNEMKRLSKDYVYLYERTNRYEEGERHENNFVFNYDYCKFFNDWKLAFSREFQKKHFVYIFRKKEFFDKSI